MIKRFFLIFTLCLLGGVMKATDFNIIPKPLELTESEGTFSFSANTTVCWRSEEARQVADFLVNKYQTATGRQLPILKLKKEGKKQKVTSNLFEFLIDPSIEGDEAYRLVITPERITASARTGDGLFYALMTFFQLCPPDIENRSALKTAGSWKIPCLTINDAPRFVYRGVHLDPCRHFLSVSAVKKNIDILAGYKINRIHFHLTEDQAWRIEIKKYPDLTRTGSRRLEPEGNWNEGFYTQDELRDIVAYAKERHIEIVPELELPGHELAAIAAYPELSCTGDSITPRLIWGVEDVVLCPGKEVMFNFFKDVIDEMVEIFPSTLFHIGGDESPRVYWTKCDSCQARMKSLGLTREAQLQDYVIERFGRYLAQKGKRIIGWDEILEGGNLEKDAIVMSWRGEEGGIEAAKKNHQVIMTPSNKGYYFDTYQGEPLTEPTAIGGYSPLEQVYSYNPVPDVLHAENKDHLVMGVQGNNWSEYIPGPATLELRLYPRALALAEVAWSADDSKDFKDFCRRVDNDATTRLVAQNVNFHIPVPEISGISSNHLAFTNSTSVSLTTSRPLPILFTTDGTSPSTNSARYISPLNFTKTTTLKTAVLLPNGLIGPIRTIYIQKQEPASAKNVSNPQPGLRLKKFEGDFRTPKQFTKAQASVDSIVNNFDCLRLLTYVPADVRNVNNYAATLEGYVKIPETGVYEFSSNCNQVYIDGVLRIDNSTVYSPRDTRENIELALEKGYHNIKVVFIGGIFGGYPTYWNNTNVFYRPSRGEWKKVSADMMFH